MDIQPEDLIVRSTLRIKAFGATNNIGTGFLWSFDQDAIEENLRLPCLITNRHVVETASYIKIRITTVESGFENFNISEI
jgi:hypothetical protein